ncbi:MAG: succinyl-diaminopimelate desuccinylase [Gammaproteobacteria bacterium]|nr:succinyl-diaminopimelate desuccinylase [Gammaproteobacteria bacterium]
MTSNPSPTQELAKELIRRPSVTPEDAGCQELIARRLAEAGLEVESMPFGNVQNLWARRGDVAPLLVFLGHTDVVPTGPETAWRSPPFEPAVRDGHLYGRGAADMKGSVAAFVCALERFVAGNADHHGSIGVMLTSDEEGPAVDGVVKVVERLQGRGDRIDWCLVGEPSSRERVGDVIKNGRRGSLTGRITVHGVQGHVAYPENTVNPIHSFARAFAELATHHWDAGNAHFPPTSFQISNVGAGTGAENVVPGVLDAMFNFRYSTESTPDALRQNVEDVLARHDVKYDLAWTHGARPFITEAGPLVDAVIAAVRTVSGVEARLSTAGGTSDGRFIAPGGAQVVELGPVNATIHSIDERVSVADLELLSRIYERVMELLLLEESNK